MKLKDVVHSLRSGRLGNLPLVALLALWGMASFSAQGQDLSDIKQAGVIRHLGVPYAHFVTGGGDGFDVELVQRFAASLGVRYEYVRTDWSTLIPDLTGRSVKARGDDVEMLGQEPIKGDIAASGITILPWRKKVVDFSDPEFPTQVWLIARADSTLRPIKPTGKLESDIQAVKRLLGGRTLLCKANTCLDPALYNIPETKAAYRLFAGSLNEVAPAVIKGEAELTLLDVPDTFVALQKWPGTIKIIGPISPVQEMGVAFRKGSPRLREAFNQFLARMRRQGDYHRLVEKYYPLVFDYFPDFMREQGGEKTQAGSLPPQKNRVKPSSSSPGDRKD